LVWDVGGQARLRKLWPILYEGASAVVFVADAAELSSGSQRLAEACEALYSLLAAPELRGLPLLLLANKKDDPQALSTRQVLQRLGLTDSTDSVATLPSPAGSVPSPPSSLPPRLLEDRR